MEKALINENINFISRFLMVRLANNMAWQNFLPLLNFSKMFWGTEKRDMVLRDYNFNFPAALTSVEEFCACIKNKILNKIFIKI